MVSEKNLEVLSDLVTEAHSQIQKDFEQINPIVGVNRGMRASGIPADIMTIDCLKTGKRIILILHDQQPDVLQYQFSFKDQDPAAEFMILKFEKLSNQVLYNWMKEYFTVA
ncbi:MAG: hypothetical protein GY829_09720 [Gammaproteobacteria bacterium]|nr:hypothetical protein [Gammaproteobacteria bacterium]